MTDAKYGERDPLSRFMIARDVEDFAQREGGVINGNTFFDTLDTDQEASVLPGIYDAYERMFMLESRSLLKYYKNPILFLNNLYLEELMQGFSGYISRLSGALSTNNIHQKTLILAHLPPLEMAIFSLLLDIRGVKNIVLNFNRAPVVNGVSKTFEAHLILLAARTNPRFTERLATLSTLLPEALGVCDIILDENDIAPNYDIASIDGYIAQSISYKEHQVILRSDEYPHANFLKDQSIDHVLILDIDQTSPFDSYYESLLEKDGITLDREVIPYASISKIGVYESYIVDKNQQYLTNRSKQREQSIISSGGGVEKYSKKSHVVNGTPHVAGTPNNASLQVSKAQAGVAIGTLAMLMIFLFIIDMRNGAPLFSDKSKYKSSSGGVRGGIGGGGWWSSGGSSSSSSSNSSYSSSSSSSKSVSSFGGGGFSKGGG